jgi:tryptophan synthase beta subunit
LCVWFRERLRGFEVVSYFCGGGSNLLDLVYCYYNEDDTDPVAIEAESYHKALTTGQPPISLSSGREIVDFDVRNISFYCILDWGKE